MLGCHFLKSSRKARWSPSRSRSTRAASRRRCGLPACVRRGSLCCFFRCGRCFFRLTGALARDRPPRPSSTSGPARQPRPRLSMVSSSIWSTFAPWAGRRHGGSSLDVERAPWFPSPLVQSHKRTSRYGLLQAQIWAETDSRDTTALRFFSKRRFFTVPWTWRPSPPPSAGFGLSCAMISDPLRNEAASRSNKVP